MGTDQGSVENVPTPTQQAAVMMEMRTKGDGYGTISKAMGMSTGMVRRIIQTQEMASC